MGSVRISIAYFLTVFGAAFLLNLCGCVGFTYLRRVDNKPLANPVQVISATADQIVLEDGRRVNVDIWHDGGIGWELALNHSQNAVEIDDPFHDGNVSVYGTRDLFICGLGAPSFTIPLFPVDVPRSQKAQIAFGRIDGE